ncbi:hypothetical protein ACTHOQ_02365 [Solibacillus silvestris]|uniref:hypothetical protein n=1 Tax=Solibacillus silvestris TaxID=76853 RepID=UPI003F801747
MSLFFIKHKYGIHEIMDVKKHSTNIELRTISHETLHIIIITDESYTVYDDRFAGASKQLTSLEAFDINSSFRNNDFDHMRELFLNALTKLFDKLGENVGKQTMVDLDILRHEISEHYKGVYFKILSDIQMNN